MSFFNELQRRNVLRVAAAYIVASWLIIQVVETLFPVFGLADAAIRVVVIVLAIRHTQKRLSNESLLVFGAQNALPALSLKPIKLK